nr:hypothetical protein [Candidatus Microthrix sp.]
MPAPGRLDGRRIVGDDIVCGVHGWDYRVATGVSAYDDTQRLQKFAAWVEDGGLFVDADEIADYSRQHRSATTARPIRASTPTFTVVPKNPPSD